MKKITLNMDVISSTIDKNVVVISDIHDDNNNKRRDLYESVLNEVMKINPDFILIPGDIVESPNFSLENINFFIKNLGLIAPTILSVGNHEMMEKRQYILKWFKSLNKFDNVYPLNNNSILLDDVNISGYTLPLKNYIDDRSNNSIIKSINKHKEISARDDKFNILLVHNPEIFNEEVINSTLFSGYDLFICGHMHNGCTPTILEPLLGNSGLFSPYHRLFSKNCRGVVNISDKDIFISKGLRKFTQGDMAFNFIDSMCRNDIHKLVLTKDK